MKRVILFPHGGSGNHGCEAIVRTTADLLKPADIWLFSENLEEDRLYMEDVNIHLVYPHKTVKRLSPAYFQGKYRTVVKNEENAMDVLSFSPILKICNKNTVLLSIGGDNYCYGNNEYIFLVNREARKKGTETILWGASVDEKQVSEKMKADLQGYSLIIARESLSYEYLKKINSNTILLPDPAFSLKKAPADINAELFAREIIGLNVSPMIIGYENIDNIVFENYKHLIEKILETTSYNIALIPHVVWKHSDDRIPLNQLYEEFKETRRIYNIPDQNCMKLKDIISKCSFFIGARTHSTIAAYSTGVPTLVVGYSIKARGIATDLFGTDKEYVLPVQDLKKPEDLYEAYMNLFEKKEYIANELKEKQELIKNQVLEYKAILKDER